jgi:hypothetical protein
VPHAQLVVGFKVIVLAAWTHSTNAELLAKDSGHVEDIRAIACNCPRRLMPHDGVESASVLDLVDIFRVTVPKIL